MVRADDGAASPDVTIRADTSDRTLAYAASELRSLLEAGTNLGIAVNPGATPAGSWELRLEVDRGLPAGCFAVSAVAHAVRLSGADPACVLHAVYTALERAGAGFDVMGPILPARLVLDRLVGWSVTVKPFVARRGVRQHLNFPMDISSYPMSEAQEYVRNLARMRMNHLAVHSYGGIWYECKLSTGEVPAGNFFYGRRHDVPAWDPVRSSVRNTKTFCIPEVEAFYDDPAAKSRVAIAWMSGVVDTARTAGMTVQFSIEPPGGSIADGVAAVRAVLSTYPQIDNLELITPEGGGEKPPTVEQTRQSIMELSGPAMLEDMDVRSALSEGSAELHATLGHLVRNLLIARQVKADLRVSKPRALCIGVYTTSPQSGAKSLAVMRKLAPAEVTLTFLPAYSASRVADTIRAMGLTPDDWRRAMIYSWAEFDGSMYVQQNPVEGIHQLLADAAKNGADGQIHGVCYNHWRNAENRTALRYAAIASLMGPQEPRAFYRDNAVTMAIRNVRSYAGAMALIDKADRLCVERLGNIGFCYIWCWFTAPGLGYTRGWSAEAVREARMHYGDAHRMLADCLRTVSSTQGRKYLRFLMNRLECSRLHLACIGELVALNAVVKDEDAGSISVDARRRVEERCDAADELARAYMRLHSQELPDRGGEGTLISYWVAMPQYIQFVRDHFHARAGRTDLPGERDPSAPALGNAANPTR